MWALIWIKTHLNILNKIICHFIKQQVVRLQGGQGSQGDPGIAGTAGTPGMPGEFGRDGIPGTKGEKVSASAVNR